MQEEDSPRVPWFWGRSLPSSAKLVVMITVATTFKNGDKAPAKIVKD